MPLSAGSRIGGYVIVGPLGAGGMGEVYKARDERLERFVALKILHTTRATDSGFRDRFEREARAIAALSHPNIVTVYSIEEHEGSPFLTMELVEGRTLADMIPPGGVSLAQFLQIAIPLSDAVAAAHARGITHRDLKPANVMVSTNGRLKVLDFGLAKLKEASAEETGFTALVTGHVTAQGQIVGTVAYMSPEQAEGKPVDHRSDIFSLGIILYELATGQKPFTGETNMSLLSSILRDAPPLVTDVNAAIPREIGRVIRRCLEKDPARRLQSALDLKHELEDLRSEGPSSIGVSTSTQSAVAAAPPTTSATSQLSAVAPPSRGALPWVAAAGAVIVLAGGYFAWTKYSDSAAPRAAASPSKSLVSVPRFENRTGDAALDAIGQMAADAILQEVPRIEAEQQALAQAAATSVRPAQARPHIDVKGSYYLEGQNLRLQASLFDGAGTLLHTIEPAVGPRTDPGQAVENVRQSVLGAVVSLLDAEFVHLHSSKLPLYGAYREFTAGVELFADEPLKAVDHFKRATEMDPDFFAAWGFMATAYGNAGDRIHQREVHERMSAMRDRLSPAERARLAWSIHSAEGRTLDALKALREVEKIDAEDLINNYLIGFFELRLNRPQAAIDEYAKVNAETWNTSTVGGWRHSRLTTANHLLGRHDEELRIARAAKAMFPSSLGTRNDELFALAALGRIDDIRRAVDDLLGLPILGTGTPGGAMRGVADELRAHGHRAESLELAKRGVAWYRNRPAQDLASETNRFALAQTLYAAEEWTEAGRMTAPLVKERPDNMAYATLLGAIAARTGDRGAAAKYAATLGQAPSNPGGAMELRRAQLAALMGEREQAVEFLRAGFARGLSMTLPLHRQMDLESLRGYAPFDELMKPKG